ncbi:ORF6C domain-containing protein [Lactobacillus gasseri]|nr:ORF6C domain-containing protein [Lactobacillus gasseri]
MNELKDLVIMKDGRAVTSSLEAAKIFDKRHDHVMRDINNLKKDVPNFGEMFFEAETTDSYGRKQKINYMNRDGFSLLVMGYTGKKAMEFKLKYIEAFNKMEAYIREQETAKQLPQTPEELLQLTMKATNHLDQRVTNVEEDIDYLKNKSEVDENQRYKLQKVRNKRCIEVCGGKESNFYKTKSRKVFMALAHDFKEYFQIPRYDALRKEDFDKAIEFINGWYPSVLLKRDIDRVNAQTDLDI